MLLNPNVTISRSRIIKPIPLNIVQAVTVMERTTNGTDAPVLKPSIARCLELKLEALGYYPEREEDVYDEYYRVNNANQHTVVRFSFYPDEEGQLEGNDKNMVEEAFEFLKQCGGLQKSPIQPELGKKVARREARKTLPATARLPLDLSRKIGQYAATPKLTGGRRRKPRKTRRRKINRSP